MSAKDFGLAEVIVGAILEFIPGAEGVGTALILGGLSTEASIYFAPKPSTEKRAIQGTIMQTDAWAELVYGTARKGGVLTYINTSDTNYERLDMVVAHAITDPTNGIDGFGDFWLNDKVLRVRPAGSWAANTVYGVGDAVMVTQGGNSYVQVCAVPGTSGSTVPTWQTDLGAVTADNTIKWKNGGTQTTDWTWDSTVCAVGSDGYVRPKSGYSHIHGQVTAGEFAGMIELWAYVGTQTVVDPTLHTIYGADPRIPYPSTAVGKGVVYSYWAFTPTPTNGGKEQFQKAFGGSIPYKLEATIRGEKVYDPRTSTTAYSENPALIVRDFMTRDPMNGGCGVLATALDDTNGTTPSANVCDQSVTYADGTTGPRFLCSGTVGMGSKRIEMVQKILDAMAGFIVTRATSVNNLAPIAIYSGSYSAPVTTLDESFLRGDVEVTAATFDELYNTVLTTFLDRNNSYQSMSAPAVPARGSTDWTTWTTDDGREIDKNLSLDFVNDADHAQLVAGVLARQSRYLETVKVECNFKAIQFNVFDRVYVDNSEFGWSGKVFKVTRIVLRPDLGVDLYLMLDDASVWQSQVPQPGSYLGESATVATTPPTPAAVTASGYSGGVKLTWTAPDPNKATRVYVYYSATSGGPYAQIDSCAAGAAQYLHPLGQGSTGYYTISFSNGYEEGTQSSEVSAISGLADDNADQTAAHVCGAGNYIYQGIGYDGVSITFPQPFNATPIVVWGAGGVAYDSTLSSPQIQRFSQTNLTPTGMTPVLRIQEVSGTTTNQSQNFSPYNSNASSATLSLGAVAWDGNYTLNFTVNVPGSYYSTTVEILMNGTSVWSKHYIGKSNPTTVSVSQTITDTALAAGQTVEIRVSAGGGTVDATTMTYQTATPPTDKTATPSGAGGVPFIAYPPN